MHRGFVYAMCGVMASTNKRCKRTREAVRDPRGEYLPALLFLLVAVLSQTFFYACG